jgi:hypothetical protein
MEAALKQARQERLHDRNQLYRYLEVDEDARSPWDDLDSSTEITKRRYLKSKRAISDEFAHMV